MRSELWVDTEVGGLEVGVHSVLSVGALAVKNGKIAEVLYLDIRIQPMVVTTEALEINKIDITTPGIETKARFKEVWMKFINRNFYDYGRVRPNAENMPFFCGQNTFFDRPFIHNLLGSTFDGAYYHRIDTMIFANILRSEDMLPEIHDLKLETMSKYFHLPEPEMFHNSLCDIKQTYKIYQCLKRVMRGESINKIRASVANESSISHGATSDMPSLDSGALGIKAD